MLQAISYDIMLAEILRRLVCKHDKLQQIFKKKGLKGLYKELGKHPGDYGLLEAGAWIAPSDTNLFLMWGLMPNQIHDTVRDWVKEELPCVTRENYNDYRAQIVECVKKKIYDKLAGHFDEDAIAWFVRDLCRIYGFEKRVEKPKYMIDDITSLYDYMIDGIRLMDLL